MEAPQKHHRTPHGSITESPRAKHRGNTMELAVHALLCSHGIPMKVPTSLRGLLTKEASG